VSRSPHPEIGWSEVSGDDGIAPSGAWFEWHYDRWTLPPQAREIARNAAASQAFTLRRNLAVQFHPELGPPMLQAWLEEGGRREASDFGLDPDQLLEQTRAREAGARERAHRLVDAFLDVVAVATTPR
jgi:GMP synthase-like glutamine amidotransferase